MQPDRRQRPRQRPATRSTSSSTSATSTPQGGLTSFIHWYKGKRLIKTGSWIKDSTSFLKNKKDGWSKNYHVFSVQWTPKTIIFRIDGKETWRTSARVSKARSTSS